MNEKSRGKNHKGLQPCGSDQENGKKGKQFPTCSPKPLWPTGLQLPTKKDITCFIPEDLAVILSCGAFEQLFGYAYATTSEICCLGIVKQEGERFRIERFHLVPQSGSLGHTELAEDAVAALVEVLIALALFLILLPLSSILLLEQLFRSLTGGSREGRCRWNRPLA